MAFDDQKRQNFLVAVILLPGGLSVFQASNTGFIWPDQFLRGIYFRFGKVGNTILMEENPILLCASGMENTKQSYRKSIHFNVSKASLIIGGQPRPRFCNRRMLTPFRSIRLVLIILLDVPVIGRSLVIGIRVFAFPLCNLDKGLLRFFRR